jgi:glucose/arabinose dehydrogenase
MLFDHSRLRVWAAAVISLTFLAACSPAAPTASVLHATTTPAISAAASTQSAPATATPEPSQAATQTAPPAEPTTAPAAAVTQLPDPAGYTWQVVASGLNKPTTFVDPNDGSGRFLVLEQNGRIRWVADGQPLEQAFLDIRAKLHISGSEQGLLGLALDPNYAQNGRFYVDYTDLNGNTVIARYTAAEGHQTADPASEEILLQISQPYANHNGGQLAFGPDGYLYIGMGDGGSGGDPQNNAQNPNQLLGKILRIAVTDAGGYLIPSDNPYAGGGGAQEVWALGLRNPWRFSFDSATGDLYIADVGQNLYEEVSLVTAADLRPGLNFGWRYFEGLHSYDDPGNLDQKAFIWPIYEYAHDQGCSVTGGYVYRGSLSEWNGIYLFGDYCSGLVWGSVLQADGSRQTQRLFQINGNLSAFGQNAQGEVYALDYLNGQILKLSRAE